MRSLFSLLILFAFFSTKAHSQDVYKTPSGKKYHLASCRMVKNVSEKITLQKALELGLGPCSICNPSAVTPKTPGENKQQGEAPATVQCKGLTKNGTRCRHRTSIGNGYCFQHQP